MKHINHVFLLLIGLSFGNPAYACEHPAGYTPIAERPTSALLYEITGCGGEKSYVFGTFHSDSPKLKPLLAFVLPYMEQTQELWVEIESTPTNSYTSMRHITLPQDHAGLKSLIGETMYQQTLEKIAPVLQMNEATISRFRPWALALLVQYPPSEADGIILDARLQNIAAIKGLQVHGLETLETQYAIFKNMPQPMQVDFLKSTLDDFEQLAATNEALQQTYLQQNLPALYTQSLQLLEQTAQHYPDLAQYLRTYLIERRNHDMASTITEKAKKPLFIAVGALHLPGEQGLLSLLETTGRQIRALPMP